MSRFGAGPDGFAGGAACMSPPIYTLLTRAEVRSLSLSRVGHGGDYTLRRLLSQCSPGRWAASRETTVLNPLAGAHHRLGSARRRDAVHVNVIRSDHPVHVNQ